MLGYHPQLDAQQEADARDPHLLKKEALAARKQKQRAMLGQGKSEQRNGISGAINSQIDFNAELLAFKALWLIGIDVLLLIFNVPYLQMQREFKVAQEGGFAYEPNANGEWPIIYKTDEEGNLDYNQPYDWEPAQIPFAEIYMNGFIPVPTAQMGFKAGLAELQNDMQGESSLSREQLMLLHRAPMNQNESEKKGEEENVRGRDAALAAAQRPVARRPA